MELFKKIMTYFGVDKDLIVEKEDRGVEIPKKETVIKQESKRMMNDWMDIYLNEAKWLKEDQDLISAGIASSIVSEISRLVVSEFKVEIMDLEKVESGEIIQESLMGLVNNMREHLEIGLVQGGMIFKPYYSDGRFYVDFILIDEVDILEFGKNGNITEIVFKEIKRSGDDYYLKKEYHRILADGYLVVNEAFQSDESGSENFKVPLNIIDSWSHLEEEVFIPNVRGPLFGVFVTPNTNKKDLENGIGMCVFYDAIKHIEQADRQWTRFLWEFEGGEMAIDADPLALNSERQMPRNKKRLFRKIDVEKSNGNGLYEVFNPSLRDQSYYNGFNRILQRIEFAVGLAYGTISDMNDVAKTATEIRISKQRSFSTVNDIQKKLKNAMKETVYALEVLYSIYSGESVKEILDLDILIDFDDSVVSDDVEERKLRLQEVLAGIRKKEDYLAWRDRITVEQAKRLVPDYSLEEGDEGLE